MIIKVNSDGTVTGVYSDMLKNANVGKMTVTRASNVEFNHDSQLWEARDSNNKLIAQGSDRDQVIRDEVAVLEARIKDSCKKV